MGSCITESQQLLLSNSFYHRTELCSSLQQPLLSVRSFYFIYVFLLYFFFLFTWF